MPTFNQLVRKGREVLVTKSTAPALQKPGLLRVRLEMGPAVVRRRGRSGRAAGAGEGSGHHNGIAMYNVNRRLNLFFGQEYGVSVRSCLGMGTDIELRIPYRVGKGL